MGGPRELTSLRSPDFQSFLTLSEGAIRHASSVGGPAHSAAERIFSALRVPSAQASAPATGRLPICRHLPAALEHARRQPAPADASWSAASPSSPSCDGPLSRQGARKRARWLYEPV